MYPFEEILLFFNWVHESKVTSSKKKLDYLGNRDQNCLYFLSTFVFGIHVNNMI